MDNDLLEALYDMITEFDEDNYTKNKKKKELKENMEEINERE